VRLIVPVAAGGPTDIVARMLGEKLSKMWNQQVVIENKGGAGTNLGNEYVAQAEPDGYTVLFATASLAVNTSLYRSLSYDPVTDFAPVSLVTQLAYFVFVPNSSPGFVRPDCARAFMEPIHRLPQNLVTNSAQKKMRKWARGCRIAQGVAFSSLVPYSFCLTTNEGPANAIFCLVAGGDWHHDCGTRAGCDS
jgi:hypothetical protein